MKMLVAYLDLLGFRAHLSESPNDALLSLGHYAEIMKILDQDSSVKYTDKHLQDIAREHGVDTFDYFLPFSDSIFIASSKDPNVFIRQLANFLCDAFTFNSDSFDPTKMLLNGYRNPLEVVEKGKTGCNAAGHTTTSMGKCLNYPVLFRGGLSYGDVVPFPMVSKVKELSQSATILTGQGVVDAVKLEESKIQGPRIIFDKDVFDALSPENHSRLCRKVPESSHGSSYELLWPNASFSDLKSDIPDFTGIADLYGKAVTLWRHYNHEECGVHYFKFSDLIISSAMQWARACGQDSEMQEHLRRLVEDYGLSGKYNALSCKARG